MIALIVVVLVLATLAYILWPLAVRGPRGGEQRPSAFEDLQPPPGEGERGERRDDT